MNRLYATVTDIVSEGSLHIVSFDLEGVMLQMMSLALDEKIRIGSSVVLTIKSTYIALARSLEGEVSYTNRIPATIREIRQGRLLSSILLDSQGHSIESIITRGSAERMKLRAGDSVIMLVKASELSIAEVLS